MPLYSTAIASISAGTTHAYGASLSLADGSGVSFGANGSTITASVAAGATATGNLGALYDGAASITSGTARFSNSNGVSFGFNGQTITASVAAAGAFGAVTAGTQNASTGVSFADSNGVSFGMAGSNTITASYDGVRSVIVGTRTAAASVVEIGVANGVSFGLNAVGGTLVTASVAAGATATGNVGGFSAGTQLGTSGTLSFADSNGISFGLDGSASLTASFNAIKSLSGGTTRITSGEAVFSDANGFRFGINGNTVTAGQQLRSGYTWAGEAGATSGSGVTVSAGSVFPFVIPYDITISRGDIMIGVSVGSAATSNTAAVAFSSALIVYSRNASTLNPIVGNIGNTTHSYASNTANYSSVTGGRFMSQPLATSLSAGQYFAYVHLSTATSSVGAATTNLGATISMFFNVAYTATPFAEFGVLTTIISGSALYRGVISSHVSNTTQTLQVSQITQTGTAAQRANMALLLRNI